MTLKQLKLSVKLDKVGKVMNGVGTVFLVVDVISSAKETFDGYMKFISQLEVMKENIYIYNAIINSNADDDLKTAAADIRNVLQEDLENSATVVWEKLGYQESDYRYCFWESCTFFSRICTVCKICRIDSRSFGFLF